MCREMLNFLHIKTTGCFFSYFFCATLIIDAVFLLFLHFYFSSFIFLLRIAALLSFFFFNHILFSYPP